MQSARGSSLLQSCARKASRGSACAAASSSLSYPIAATTQALKPPLTNRRASRDLSTSLKPLLPSKSHVNRALAVEGSGSQCSSDYPPTFYSSSAHEADAAALKDIFDAPQASTQLHSSSASSATGLFGSPSLMAPQDFVSLRQRTYERAQLLVTRIISAPQNGEGEMRKVVKNLDRLSDLLCGVIDLAELVRNAHPDAEWRDAAK